MPSGPQNCCSIFNMFLVDAFTYSNHCLEMWPLRAPFENVFFSTQTTVTMEANDHMEMISRYLSMPLKRWFYSCMMDTTISEFLLSPLISEYLAESSLALASKAPCQSANGSVYADTKTMSYQSSLWNVGQLILKCTRTSNTVTE